MLLLACMHGSISFEAALVLMVPILFTLLCSLTLGYRSHLSDSKDFTINRAGKSREIFGLNWLAAGCGSIILRNASITVGLVNEQNCSGRF